MLYSFYAYEILNLKYCLLVLRKNSNNRVKYPICKVDIAQCTYYDIYFLSEEKIGIDDSNNIVLYKVHDLHKFF